MDAFNTKLMVIKLLAILLLCVAYAESTSKPAHIFLLAGQSNMAGIGGISPDFKSWDHIVPPESHPTPAILRLNPKLHWEVAKEPLHAGIDVNLTNGVGPGLPFANCVFSKTPGYSIIGLVPCAISGTKIIQWQKGTQFYDDLVRRAIAARESGGIIEALLWYQGESDALSKNDDDAYGYEERLKQFIIDLRKDLNSPTLLVIQVALASGGRNIEMVRKAQLHTDLPNVTCVDAMGLPLQQDNLHLSTPAQVRLGNMLCDAFLSTIYV